jgi:hypothetical protein
MLGHRQINHVPFGIRQLVRIASLAAALSIAAGAADFDLAATIQAGRIDNTGFELGIGPSANSAAIQGQVNGADYFQNGASRKFEIGYDNATNSAYLRFYHSAINPNAFYQVVHSPGGAGLGGNSLWTIPAGSLFVSATFRPVATSITISGLQFGSGITVIQPFSATSMTASQNRSSSTLNSTAPVLFLPSANGDWLLSGNISFSGLRTPGYPGAIGNQLAMGMGFNGSSVPEPGVAGLTMAGLAVIAYLEARRRRRSGAVRA